MKFIKIVYVTGIIMSFYLALFLSGEIKVSSQSLSAVQFPAETEEPAEEEQEESETGQKEPDAAEEEEEEQEEAYEEEPETEAEETEEESLPEGTVVARTEAELYAAINSPVVTTIHLGADITLKSETTKDYEISSQKSFLILDGTNPYAETESDRKIIHTLTDRDSASADRVLRVWEAGSLRSVTIQNMDIIGRNHYGIVCTEVAGIYMYYENIIYSGPQLTYNPNGSAHYYNCNITIAQNGVSAVGEVAEAPDILLEGSIVIDKSVAGADEIFYLRASSDTAASLKIAPGADVEITHNKTENGGLIYSAQEDYPVIIGKDAVFRFHGYHFIVENLAPALFEVEEGAQVYIDFVTLGYRAGLFTKSLVIGRDAVFHMEAGYSIGAYPLVTIRDGGSAVFHDPLSVVLKINGSNPECVIMKGTGTSPTLVIECEQLNYWSDINGGGLSVLPAYHWQKAESSLSLQAVLNDRGTYENIKTNYDENTDRRTPSWLNEDVLNSTTLNGRTGSILSMGKLSLTAEFSDRPAAAISGNTGNSAYVQARPAEEPGEILWGPVQADPAGRYTVPIKQEWEEGESVMMLANQGWLYQQAVVETIHPGYQLTYAGNGHTTGEAPEDTRRYEVDTYAVVQGSGTLEKEGYQFAGWSLDTDEAGKLYEEGDQIMMDEDKTLYAVWKEVMIETEFAFIKVDETNYKMTLAGAAFMLMRCTEEHGDNHAELAGSGNADCWELFQYEVSRADGQIVFRDLTEGEYQLVETIAPEGYELPSGQWRLQVRPMEEYPIQITAMGSVSPPGFLQDEQTGTLLLPNERKIQLPLTGGTPVRGYVAGIAGIFTALIYSLRKQRLR